MPQEKRVEILQRSELKKKERKQDPEETYAYNKRILLVFKKYLTA